MKQTTKTPVKNRTGRGSNMKKNQRVATSSIKIPTYTTKMGLTSKQAYKLNKKTLNNARRMNDTKADQIRAIGEAVATGTAPAASALTSSKISSDASSVSRQKDQKSAYKIADIMVEWNKLFSGNPDKETGQDGTEFTREPSLGGG